MTEPNKTVPLNALFIAHASKLLKKIQPDQVDVNILHPYENLLPQSGIVDLFNAQQISVKVMEAMSISKLYSKVCKAFALASDVEADRVYSVKTFEAKDALEKAGGKSTEGAKEAWVKADQDYLTAIDTHNSWLVLAEFFESTMFEYQRKLDWLRDIIRSDLKTGAEKTEA